jgi:aconitate hydratase
LPTLLRQAGVPPRGIGVPVHAGAGDHAGLIDTPGEADYFRHGGIMQCVLRSLLD